MCHVHVRVCGAFVCDCTCTCTCTYIHALIHMNAYIYILMYVYKYYKNLHASYNSKSPSSPCRQKNTIFHAHFTNFQDIFHTKTPAWQQASYVGRHTLQLSQYFSQKPCKFGSCIKTVVSTWSLRMWWCKDHVIIFLIVTVSRLLSINTTIVMQTVMIIMQNHNHYRTNPGPRCRWWARTSKSAESAASWPPSSWFRRRPPYADPHAG